MDIKSQAERYAEKFRLIPETKGWYQQKVDDFTAGYEAALRQFAVMQGLPTENEIRAQALLVENPNDSYATKIIARAAYESGARWVISRLSSSPTVASEGGGEANTCAGECTCKTVTEIWGCQKRCATNGSINRA